MDAVSFYPRHCLLSCSAFTNSKLRRSGLATKEIADWPSLFAPQRGRGLRPQFRISSIRAEGERPPPKKNKAGRTPRDDENNIDQSTAGKSSDQEEIIALFKRITASIAKEQPRRPKKRISYKSEDERSAELVLDVLRQSRKQVKARNLEKGVDKIFEGGPGIPSEDLKTEPKGTRPPSNFVKRSPISSPTTLRRVVEPKGEESSSTSDGVKYGLEKIEEMKVSELRELAKSRGIKGYSKMRKSQLVETLRS